MDLTNVDNIVVGTLSDGRLQVWANSHTSIHGYSRWKATPDPNSGWSAWQQLPADYDNLVLLSAPMSATGQLQLFGNKLTKDPRELDPTLLYFRRVKATIDSDSDWLSWTPFEVPYASSFFAGAVLGGQMAPYSTNTPVEYWTIESGGLLLKFVEGVDEDWQFFDPDPVDTDYFLSVWPLYMGYNDLAPSTFQLWAMDTSGHLSWSTAAIEYESPVGRLPQPAPAWGPWQPFPSLPGGYYVSSLAASQLPDQRIQVFAADTNGSLWSIWQTDVAGDWTPAWQSFPGLPNGQPILHDPHLSPDQVPNGTQQILALAPLPDARLQLFAVDDEGSVWTTWKETTDADSGWGAWTQF
jgi:hypothetical protein